ncbi:MAG: fumarylacetoacetate hydrolase family protein [Myxococcales bacterium]|nr:fumarylacetoacetate hydrolase family protein [Polyangiaceae bacterium]MDW8251391.1 fumarylacetoacetate hydrolase family protein [Myxococcales bacterium]
MATWARLLTSSGARYAVARAATWDILSAAPWAGGQPTGEQVDTAEARLLAPVEPSKIICVGRNYRAHAVELGNDIPAEPLLFFKPPSAMIGPGAPIRLPAASQRVDHEGELGLVVGRRCHRVHPDEARSVLAGFTCVNDVTARDLQKRDGQWARAKGFDSFCPVGPVVVDNLDLAEGQVVCRVNGIERQRGRFRDMIFSIADLVSYISHIFTLEPGDLLVTGTPEGVAPLTHGDVVEVEVPGIGLLSNPVCQGD